MFGSQTYNSLFLMTMHFRLASNMILLHYLVMDYKSKVQVNLLKCLNTMMSTRLNIGG